MRLGQFARKYNIPAQDVISYLKDKDLNQNSKLDKETELRLSRHFIEEPEDNEMIAENIVDSQDRLEAESVVSNTTSKADEPTKQEADSSNNKESSIQSDQLLELLEEDELPIDLDEIKVIKAPKKELDGLKVVGKIKLPEPKKKSDEEEDEKSEAERAKPKRRRLVSDEELEERRLKAKRKKDAYDARQARRRKEAEEKKRKAKKEAHYRKKIKEAKSIDSKPRKILDQKSNEPYEPEELSRPKPRTWLGKLWWWIDHPD